MRGAAIVFVVVIGCSGCLHVPLKNNFLDQSTTISELEHQQVIDNLAKFAVDPASLPHFAVPDSGTTQMAAQVSGGMLFNYTRVMFSGWNFNFGGNSTEQENWVMKPVNDPGRLKRMRCAYQLAIGAHPGLDAASDCVACINELRKVGLIPESTTNVESSPAQAPERLDAEPAAVDAELSALNCNFPRDWYGIGCRKDVPKCARYVGRYCGTYVWVLPDQLDSFTRFTLTVLTLATTDPPAPNAEVERTLDANKVVIGYKVKTKENVKFDSITKGDQTQESTPKPTTQESARFSGPQSEVRRDVSSPASALQGLIQLESR